MTIILIHSFSPLATYLPTFSPKCNPSSHSSTPHRSTSTTSKPFSPPAYPTRLHSCASMPGNWHSASCQDGKIDGRLNNASRKNCMPSL